MLYLVLSLLALSYVVFIFASNLCNPFIEPKAPLKRRRWRLGRAAILCSLAGGSIALSFIGPNMLDRKAALLLYLIITTVSFIPAMIKYKQTSLWRE